MIPDKQMTDEEKQAMQARIDQANAEAEAAAQQGSSIMDQAIIEQTQANTADIQSKASERNAKIINMQDKQEFEEAKFASSLDQQQFDNFMETQKAAVKELVDQVNALKTLRESIGADQIIGPTNTQAYKQQADIVLDTQETQT
jgi:hypothetical protein